MALAAVLAATATAQTRPAPTPAATATDTATDTAADRSRDWLHLRQQLEARPRPALADRDKLLRAFLDRHAATADAEEVLEANLLLAGLHLSRLDAEAARSLFAAVAAKAPATGSSLGARALFGVHQAAVLAGDAAAAKSALAAIDPTTADARLRAAIELAQHHLADKARVAVGQPMPRLGFGLDSTGRPMTAERFAEAPRLLVFWSVAHAPSQRRLEALAAAWHRCGLPPQNLVAFALEDDDIALQRMVDQRQWKFPVVPANGRGYLHQDWLRLRVIAVPTVFLVGADDVLLAQDVTPDRLADLLRR